MPSHSAWSAAAAIGDARCANHASWRRRPLTAHTAAANAARSLLAALLPRPRPCHAAAHEAVRWWNAAQAAGDRAQDEAAAPCRRVDVFGVARPELPADAAAHLARLQWLALRPGCDARVAGKADVQGVACSGAGPNDVQVAKDCRAAGKAVFVESLVSRAPPLSRHLARPGPPPASAPLPAVARHLRHARLARVLRG